MSEAQISRGTKCKRVPKNSAIKINNVSMQYFSFSCFSGVFILFLHLVHSPLPFHFAYLSVNVVFVPQAAEL